MWLQGPCPASSSSADLQVLGGIEPVVAHLQPLASSPPSSGGESSDDGVGSALIRAAAAHVLGTAASNNVKFQQQLLDTFPDIFEALVQVRGGEGTGIKGGAEQREGVADGLRCGPSLAVLLG